eukprot:TRINITY_DN5885_c0_g1_i1.p1 TRINITY_DN5885_c0_g1~~TRINITY_DN5885_c0_g1_i1.p1  ORF type:complete len:1099 (+),score=198.08 TRINITY_DN5885_c0_g1_i1:23-3319(+)
MGLDDLDFGEESVTAKDLDAVHRVETSIEHVSHLVRMDWYRCCYRPISMSREELQEPDSARRASQRFNASFELSLRERFRISIIVFGSLYAFSHLTLLLLEPLGLEEHRDGVDPKLVYSLRAAVVVFCMLLVASPYCRNWRWISSWLWHLTHAVVLLKSLALCGLQLLQRDPSYGYIIFNQAFVYTFLPIHPHPTFAIMVTTLCMYTGMGLWYFDIDEKHPFIATGILLLQAGSHCRRYNWMMQGNLQMCNINHQKGLIEDEEVECDNLLQSMLPSTILMKLQSGMDITPERFDSVTVVFAEICHFSSITQNASANDVVVILNDVFRAMDELTDKWGVHKVETVCQVYMAVAGCPERSEDHAQLAANMALDMLKCIKDAFNPKSTSQSHPLRKSKAILGDKKLEIHVGLNSGPVRAGVIGIRNTRFKLFGDTVNTASRMESTCAPQRAQVSPSTHSLLQKSKDWHFAFEERGEVQIKGKGIMRPYYLLESWLAPSALESNLPLVMPATLNQNVQALNRQKSMRSVRSGGGLASIQMHDVMQGLSNMRDREHMHPKASPLASKFYEPSAEVACRAGTSGASAGFKLAFRRMILKITVNLKQEDYQTQDLLQALDEDYDEFQTSHFSNRLAGLRSKGLVGILLMSLLAWTDFWYYAAIGDWTFNMHLTVTLRTGISVPLIVLLLMLSQAPDLFAKHGQWLATLLILAIGGLVVHSSFTSYGGDPGLFIAFLFLYLDVNILDMRWRLLASVLLLCIYTVLAIVLAAEHILSLVVFLVFIFFCFCLAVHGQEHYTHLSDFKLRALQTQKDKMTEVQDMKWQLLKDFLPPTIARRLMDRNVDYISETYQDVTILFTDMKGFTAFSSKLDPAELAVFLNSLYSAFDEILERFGLHKVEVIGDAYFVVSGAPETEANIILTPEENAAFAADAALAMVNVLGTICEDDSVCIRVGLHSGSAVGGVVGQKDPRFHLFGHTVELANRMEEYGEPNRVHISEATHKRLQTLASEWSHRGDDIFKFEDRGPIEIASEPQPVNTYFLLRSTWSRHYKAVQRLEHRRQASLKLEDGSLECMKSNQSRRGSKASNVEVVMQSVMPPSCPEELR